MKELCLEIEGTPLIISTPICFAKLVETVCLTECVVNFDAWVKTMFQEDFSQKGS